MKKIKVLAFTLALGIAGVVYASSGNAQLATQACEMKQAGSCCMTNQSCCNGGACCMMGKQ